MSIYKQKLKNNKKIAPRKKLLLILIPVLLIATGTSYVVMRRNYKQQDVNTTDTPKTNYVPATPTEKGESENTKDSIVKQQGDTPSSTSTTPGQKKSVTPVITNANGSINGYVSGIFEEGGTCTATFTMDSKVLSKTSAGFGNVSYTQCAPINLEPGFLSPGTWRITLKYSSTTAEGSSAPQTVEVH